MILHLWFYCIFDPIDAAVMCIRNILPTPYERKYNIYNLFSYVVRRH